jgi:ATP-dependent DNA helicase Q1
MSWDSDHVGSDDLEMILDMSASNQLPVSRPRAQAGPSRPTNGYHGGPTYERKQTLNVEIAKLDAELTNIDEEISKLRELRKLRAEERQKLVDEYERASAPVNAKGKGKATGGIDYGSADFEWSGELRSQMKKVFNIDNFRLCQQGWVSPSFIPVAALLLTSVCNANMDRRDIVCVMPTGDTSLNYCSCPRLNSLQAVARV